MGLDFGPAENDEEEEKQSPLRTIHKHASVSSQVERSKLAEIEAQR